MKELVIAEKPSVARDIARVLKCQKQLNGAMEGEKYIVTWGLGHLVTLADPEDYDKKYKEWKLEDLPMMPETFRLEVIRQTAKQYNAVKEQIHRKDVGGIIIATDAGREGELVARLILKKAGARKPLKRLWISSVTDKAIREGFAHLKDGREYEPLYDAAMCRAEADWLVGINATRALTCKYNAQLSCGRVQTPTLAMIASREEEIRRFVPKPYYGIRGRAGSLTLAWKDKKSGSGSSFQKERIENILKELSGKQAVVERVKKTPKKTMAPLLYDLTELQRNMKFYNLLSLIRGPIHFYDVQKLFAIQYETMKSRRALEYAADFLHLPKDEHFHQALSDAKYTAENQAMTENGKYSANTSRLVAEKVFAAEPEIEKRGDPRRL